MINKVEDKIIEQIDLSTSEGDNANEEGNRSVDLMIGKARKIRMFSYDWMSRPLDCKICMLILIIQDSKRKSTRIHGRNDPLLEDDFSVP
jgi:hypothetical protein